MTYAYQIVLPPFILWLFQTLNSKSIFSTIAFCLLIGNILILDNILLNPSFLRQRDSVEWADLRNLIRNSRRIANCPAVASILIDTGILPIDSGQTEYYYNIKPYPDNKLFGPSYNTIKGNGITYRQSIRNAIIKREFDRIILTDGYPNLVSLDTLSQYYKVKTITIDMPQVHQTWVIGIWEPISR